MRAVAEIGRRFPLPPYRGWYRSGLGAQVSLPRTIQAKGLELSPTLSLLSRVLTASLISSVFFLIASSNDSSPSAERTQFSGAVHRVRCNGWLGAFQDNQAPQRPMCFAARCFLSKCYRRTALST